MCHLRVLRVNSEHEYILRACSLWLKWKQSGARKARSGRRLPWPALYLLGMSPCTRLGCTTTVKVGESR